MISLVLALSTCIATTGVESPADLALLHSAAVARWETVDARLEMTSEWLRTTYQVRYLKSDKSIRCEERSTQRSGDLSVAVSRDAKTTSVFTGPTYGKGSATIKSGRDAYFMCCPPLHLLFGFPGTPPETAVSFDEFLSQKGATKSVAPVRINGRDLIRATISVPSLQDLNHAVNYELDFDPSVNYLARKCVIRIDGKDADRIEREITEFREIQAGIFFPVSSKSIAYRNNKPVETISIKTIELHVNEPIEDSVFRLAIPNGALVVDQDSGASYHASENAGKTDVVNSPLGAKMTTGVVRRPGDPEPTPYQQRMESESQSSSLWPFLTAIVLAFSFIGLHLFRKRQAVKSR